jgi:hypothetical protein
VQGSSCQAHELERVGRVQVLLKGLQCGGNAIPHLVPQPLPALGNPDPAADLDSVVLVAAARSLPCEQRASRADPVLSAGRSRTMTGKAASVLEAAQAIVRRARSRGAPARRNPHRAAAATARR